MNFICLAEILAQADISEALTARLRAVGCRTVQDLEDWLTTPVASGEGYARFRRLTDIPGINEEKAKRLAQAIGPRMKGVVRLT